MILDDSEEPFSSAASLDTSHTAPDYVPLITPDSQTSESNELPKSVLEYYLSIEKVLEGQDFDNDTGRALLEDKLLDQLKVDGVLRILYHWDGSRVIERLLVACSTSTLLDLGTLLLPHTVHVACHVFGSHVLELFVTKLVSFIYTQEEPALLELVEQLFRKLCLSIPDLIASVHGSYTLRAALQVLVGMRVEEEKKRKKRWEIGRDCFFNIAEKGRCTHPTLKRILHKFTKRIVKEDVVTMVTSDQGAPLIGVLLLLLHKTDNKALALLKTSITTLLQEQETQYKGVDKFGPLPAVLLNSRGSYVIQALLKVSTKQELQDLYTKFYKNLIVPLSLHNVANYTIQTLLEHCPDRVTADEICSDIVPIFEDLLAESITGVVIHVIKCCHHYSLTSHNVMKVLQDSFHVPDEQVHLMFRCLMSLTTHDILLEKMESYKKPTQSGKLRRDRFEATLTGSLLLQGLFKLGEISLLEDGICSLSEDHILYLSTNVQSSHALEAYLNSLTIPATAKHRFIKTAVFVSDKLAVSPSGSRIVEGMWNAADNDLKSSIAEVLIEKEQGIRDNSYGAIVWRKCNLKSFKLGVHTWEEEERKKKKKIQDFDVIINTDHENNNVNVNPVTQKRKKKSKDGKSEVKVERTKKSKKSKSND